MTNGRFNFQKTLELIIALSLKVNIKMEDGKTIYKNGYLTPELCSNHSKGQTMNSEQFAQE